MNAPVKTVALQLGEATVHVPAEVAARAYLEKLLDESRPVALSASFSLRETPAIGAEWKDGIYAGPTILDNEPLHLVLLPNEFAAGPHEAALKWSEERGAALPSRFDSLVLFTNLKDKFQREYYWCNELRAGYPDYAWCQGFDGGGQYWGSRDGRCRAVAVRRYPIR